MGCAARVTHEETLGSYYSYMIFTALFYHIGVGVSKSLLLCMIRTPATNLLFSATFVPQLLCRDTLQQRSMNLSLVHTYIYIYMVINSAGHKLLLSACLPIDHVSLTLKICFPEGLNTRGPSRSGLRRSFLHLAIRVTGLWGL